MPSWRGREALGKTTASNRLSGPWRSLCDDMTLVVRDPQGHYWAHPWPTWARFSENAPGTSWPVPQAVPLGAFFFLSQTPTDSATPLNTAQTIALLIESVQQASAPMVYALPKADAAAVYEEQLAAASELARTIPAYRLNVSLEGAFWKEMESVLAAPPARPAAPRRASRPSPRVRLPEGPPLRVVYTGPSMNPTLREPDLLQVVSYDGRAVCKGDVIYFHPPGGEWAIVHRVVRVLREGVRTRGDHNPMEDPYPVPHSAIIGQVVAAQRGGRRRRVAGGWQGRMQYHLARLEGAALRLGQKLLSRLYHGLARSGLFHRVVPPRLTPRLVGFETRRGRQLKVMMGSRAVAHYDPRRGVWQVRRPFRLFVDEAVLPRPEGEFPPSGQVLVKDTRLD